MLNHLIYGIYIHESAADPVKTPKTSPGYWIADLKLGKNIRFAGKRLNVGVDIYNLFNNDVVRDYQNTFPASGAGVAWGTPTVLLSPRFARLQVQFDF